MRHLPLARSAEHSDDDESSAQAVTNAMAAVAMTEQPNATVAESIPDISSLCRKKYVALRSTINTIQTIMDVGVNETYELV